MQLEGIHALGKFYPMTLGSDFFPKDLQSSGNYTFTYRQYLGNAPIFYTDGPLFLSQVDDEPFLEILCNVDVLSRQDYALFGGISQVDGVLHEDIPLSPISELKAVLEAEIMAGRLRKLDRIELGYLIYHDSIDLDSGWAIPVWKCVAQCCADELGNPDPDSPHYASALVDAGMVPLYIPAQNPVFDQFSTDPNRKVATELITYNKE